MSSLLPENGGDGSNGFVINGIDSGDLSGRSVSDAGDVNGDGVDDLIIGAPYNGAGESYVVFGSAAGVPARFDLSTLDGTNGFVLNGIDPGDYSGISVSGAGDVNADGVDDLLVGGFWADPNGLPDAGEAYVLFGSTMPWSASVDLATLDGTNGLVINGLRVGDEFGWSVSGAGDINGDGIDDMLIGARFADPSGLYNAGEVYVIFGSASGLPASLDVATLDGSNGFVLSGTGWEDHCGWWVNEAGDVNADGIDDFIIGVYNGDPNGQYNAGEAYVVFGSTAPWSASFDVTALDGTNGFVINGIYPLSHSGVSVAGAGDINGDGVDDVLVGSVQADPNGVPDAGQAYVVFGSSMGLPASINATALNGTNGFVINGVDAVDHLGYSVSAAGDVNGDGLDDLIIGAYLADPNSVPDAGETYIVFGSAAAWPATLSPATLDGTNGFVLNGIDGGDWAGLPVSGAGDVNGDGVDDVIIGAVYADPNGVSDAGESYVVFGKKYFTADELGEAVADLPPGAQVECPTDPHDVNDWIDAIEALPERTVTDPATENIVITLNLQQGSYRVVGDVSVPAGYTLVVYDKFGRATTFIGESPALSVASGMVFVENGVTFVNTTDTATIRLSGGSLTLRDAVIEETDVGSQAAIEVLGGTLNLGTVAEPGGNTLVIHGDGRFIDNQSATAILTLGNTYVVDDVPVFFPGDPVVVGTPAAEHVTFAEGANPGEIVALITGLPAETVTTATNLVAYGGDGDDTMQVEGGIVLPAWLYGEGGHDKLRGGGGNDRIFGGPGDDLIVGKSGRDLLVGGSGADRMVGNADDDILIAGVANFSAANADAVMERWLADEEALSRKFAVEAYLWAEELVVQDDDDRDVLTGSSGTDWFFANLDGGGVLDKVTDLDDELFATDLDFILAG